MYYGCWFWRLRNAFNVINSCSRPFCTFYAVYQYLFHLCDFFHSLIAALNTFRLLVNNNNNSDVHIGYNSKTTDDIILIVESIYIPNVHILIAIAIATTTGEPQSNCPP